MWLWELVVEAWPFSTGAGQEQDQQSCGPRSVPCHVRCDSVHEAVKYADIVSQTLKRNPAIWKAPITSVRKLSTAEEIEVGSRGA